MQRHLSFVVAALFVFVLLPAGVQGQDDAIREAIDKAVEQAKKAITQEVEKVLQASEKRIEEQELKRFLGQKLPHYMIPAVFVTMSALPLNANQTTDANNAINFLIVYGSLNFSFFIFRYEVVRN